MQRRFKWRAYYILCIILLFFIRVFTTCKWSFAYYQVLQPALHIKFSTCLLVDENTILILTVRSYKKNIDWRHRSIVKQVKSRIMALYFWEEEIWEGIETMFPSYPYFSIRKNLFNFTVLLSQQHFPMLLWYYCCRLPFVFSHITS